MFGKNISERSLKALVAVSSSIFAALAILYFLPVGIPYRIAFPLVALAVFSLWLVPPLMTMAFFASAAGDFMGAAGNFMGQMECFAVAHLFIILYFVRKLFQAGRTSRKSFASLVTGRRVVFAVAAGCAVTAVLLAAMVCIVPEVPSGVERGGVAFYCLIISLMLFSAVLQRSVLYALGAVLFVFSDFVLAWNRYVEPVGYSSFLIMISYYLAQWLLYLRSTPYRVAPSFLRSAI